LTINFRMPYLSLNIAEFWRRWHISLSSWLRDYLFIPLGGSRGGRWLVARNLMITMMLGGLWHGANWSFVIWGVLHGTLLIVHRTFRDFCEHRSRLTAALETWIGQLLRMGLTFLAVCLCWIFFQPSLGRAVEVFGRLLSPLKGLQGHTMALFAYLVMIFAIGHLVGSWSGSRKLLARVPSPLLGGAYALMFIASLLLTPAASKTFIYFQF
jgi:D-alanyl-lipoteichoic acid acyltransferase DltB (MBOAT superfamily)